MKKTVLIVYVLVMALSLSACFCSHEWVDASCTAPMTCSKCEKTEGEALGHVWVDATCTEPKTCSACAETEGEALGHTWLEATFTAPITCSVCAETEGDPLEKNDAGFIIALARGLEARWELSSKETASTAEEHKEIIQRCVNNEIEQLGALSEYTFEDEQLAALAEEYFDALNAQLKGVKYYDVDYTMYTKVFTVNGYNKRATAIYQISEKYDLDIDSKYSTIYSEFLTIGESMCALENLLTQELVLEFAGNTYDMVIENTTDFDLSDAVLGFKLYNEDGVIINSQDVYVLDWPSGSKYRASLYPMNMGGESFATAEMNISLMASDMSTEYVPVEYVNDMIIEILAPKLPIEVDYGYSGKVWTSLVINDFSYKDTFWNNGTANVELSFSGKKTYDKDGNNATSFASAIFKLYDEDNTVAASGNIYANDLRVNESFKSQTAYASDIAPGVYRLVIEDNMS